MSESIDLRNKNNVRYEIPENSTSDIFIYAGQGKNIIAVNENSTSCYINLESSSTKLDFGNATIDQIHVSKKGDELWIQLHNSYLFINNYFSNPKLNNKVILKDDNGDQIECNLNDLINNENDIYPIMPDSKNVVKGSKYSDYIDDENLTFPNAKIYAGSGNDDIYFRNKQVDIVNCEDGDDSIYIDSYCNKIDGGEGNDDISGNEIAKVNGGDGNDSIQIFGYTEYIDGGKGNDYILTSLSSELIKGGDGNDIIDSYAGHDTVYGGKGDDYIAVAQYAEETDGDIIYGEDGNDTIVDYIGNNTINAGKGDNLIDIYSHNGKHSVTLILNSNKYASDHISFSNVRLPEFFLNQIEGIKNNNDLVLVYARVDDVQVNTLTLKDYFKYKGNSSVDVDCYINANITPPIDGIQQELTYDKKFKLKDVVNVIYDRSDANSKGSMTGTLLNDTYNVKNGDGDIIIPSHSGGYDKIVFSDMVNPHLSIEDILSNNNNIYIKGRDIIIKYNGEDTVTLKDYVKSTTQDSPSIKQIEFTDHTSMRLDSFIYSYTTEVKNKGSFLKDDITGTEKNDVIYSYANDDTINAREGNNKVYAGKGNDSIVSGNGNDSLYGEDGDDTIEANDGDDKIYSGDGNNNITAGEGKDLITLGNGENTLNFEVGHGEDTVVRSSKGGVTYYNFTTDSSSGAFLSSMKFEKQGNNLLLKAYGNDTDVVTIKNYFSKSRYEFEDKIIVNGDLDSEFVIQEEGRSLPVTLEKKTTIKMSDLIDYITGSAENDVIYTYGGDDTVNAGEGADKVYGGDGNDSIQGGTGNDSLYGDNGDDELYGEAGDDKIYSGDGDNVITGGTGDDLITLGNGENTINISVNEGVDTIVRGSKGGTTHYVVDAEPESLSYEKEGNNLIVKSSNNDLFVIKNYFVKSRYTYNDIISFTGSPDNINIQKDGVIKQDFSTAEKGQKITGKNLNDVIIGSDSNDTINTKDSSITSIEGGKGNDNITVNGNENVLKFKDGDGRDVITEAYNSKNIYDITTNTYYNNTTFEQSKNKKDLIIHYNHDSNDSITIKNYFSTSNFLTEDIIRVNGNDYFSSSIKFGYINEINKSLETEKLNTTIYGTDFFDNIISPYYDIEQKSSTKIYAYGGNNEIYAYSKMNTIYGGIDQDFIYVRNDDTTNKIYTYDGMDSISIYDNSYSNSINTGNDSDTITINNGQYNNINAGSGDDSINSKGTYNTIYAGSGDDTVSVHLVNGKIYGEAGNDSIELYSQPVPESIRKKAVTIDAGSGDDTVSVYSSNAKIYAKEGNDSITIDDSVSNTTIYAGKGDDYINIKSSRYNNYIFAEDGNDTINIGYNTEEVNAGKGNNIICINIQQYNADPIENTVVVNSSSYANDKLVMLVAESGNIPKYCSWEIDGNDLVLYQARYEYDKERTLRLKNYMKYKDNSSIGSEILIQNSIDDEIPLDTINLKTDVVINHNITDANKGVIQGTYFNDVYTFHNGDGNITLYLSEGNDKIVLPDMTKPINITPDDFENGNSEIEIKGNDILIHYDGENTITIKGYFSNEKKDVPSIKEIKFSNGSITLDEYIDINPLQENEKTDGGSFLPDSITGNDLNNTLYGYANNDTIDGGKGNDKIYGGVGSDSLIGNDGNDTIYANESHQGDVKNITGGVNNDSIYLSKEKNVINYNAGDGTDTIIRHKEGGINEYHISGIRSSDLTYKRVNNDMIIDNSQNLDDSIIIKNYFSKTKSEYSDVVFVDGTEVDLKEITEYTYDNSNLEKGATIKGANFVDNITGSNYNDVIYGYDSDDYIMGNEGNDKIYGGDGYDNIEGNLGNDKIYGGNGNDYIEGNLGNNTIYGDNGDDTIEISGEKDEVYGGNGHDEINSYSANAIIYGDNGNDTIYIDNGNATIDGGAGDDAISITSSEDSYVINDKEGNDFYEFWTTPNKTVINDSNGLFDKIDFSNNNSASVVAFFSNKNPKELYLSNIADFGNENKSILIKDAFGKGKIENITTSDGYYFDYSKVHEIQENVTSWLSENNFASVEAVLNSDQTEQIQALQNIYASAWTPGAVG